jgi:hypothetical protein
MDVSFHCLRHTAVSLLKDAGVANLVAQIGVDFLEPIHINGLRRQVGQVPQQPVIGAPLHGIVSDGAS